MSRDELNPPDLSGSAPEALPATQGPRGLLWFAVAITIIVFVAGLYPARFSSDSWAYLELSKTVFHDFFRTNTQRQFEWNSPYNTAFPPLWPVLIALFRRVCDLGIYSGVCLNFLCCLLLLWNLRGLTRALEAPGWVGLTIYLCVLMLPGFQDELVAGRSIPLSILLLSVALRLAVRPDASPAIVTLTGLVMGFSCINRFDALLAAAVIGAALLLSDWRRRRAPRRTALLALCYAVPMMLVLAPWAVYNLHHFGVPFASDNSRQVRMAERGFVLNYYQHPARGELLTAPRAWIRGLRTSKLPPVYHGIMSMIRFSALPAVLIGLVVIWAGVRRPRLPVPLFRFISLGLVLIPFLILPSLLVGYPDERYYSPVFLVLIVAALMLLYGLIPGAWIGPRVWALVAVLIFMPVYDGLAKPMIRERSALLHLGSHLAPLAPTASMRQLSGAVQRDSGGRPHRLIDTDDQEAAVYGALTGEPVSCMPHVLEGTFASFVRRWHITHIYDPVGKLEGVDLSGVKLVPLDYPKLYRVETGEVPRFEEATP